MDVGVIQLCWRGGGLGFWGREIPGNFHDIFFITPSEQTPLEPQPASGTAMKYSDSSLTETELQGILVCSACYRQWNWEEGVASSGVLQLCIYNCVWGKGKTLFGDGVPPLYQSLLLALNGT